MIACSNMLMIGAASRNVGKTEFACELIRRSAATRPVYGIKVTTVQERDGSCSRGGRGRGACTSLKDSYCVIEEGANFGQKDTARMLRAGAQKVWWLRVLPDHIEAGLLSVLERIPAHALVVCESNFARTVLKPGLFLVVRELGATAMKPSCQAVLPHADRVVGFDGRGWDFQPTQIAVLGDRWVMWPDATAVILAGGESLRMGFDKSMLKIGDRPMIEHIADQLAFFPERLIGSNDSARFDFLKIRVVLDQIPGRGPLMGILSCVDRAVHELCFVTGCDIPTLDPQFILHVLAQADDHDIVMPQFADGRVEPLLAVYRKTVVPVARAIVERGGRRIVELFDHLRVRFVSGDSLGWYHNLNTMDDYRRWMAGGTSGPPDGP